MTVKKIERHTIDEHAKAVADYLPGGKLWVSKNIANAPLRDFIVGISREFLRAEDYLIALQEQFIPDVTENFISDWEKALGVPDGCLVTTGTIEERRRNILVKLASLGVQTVDDFQNLADIFGITATVYPGEEAPTTPPDPKFTIVIEFIAPEGFPYTFPFIFGSETILILECLFNKLKPANAVVQFVHIT